MDVSFQSSLQFCCWMLTRVMNNCVSLCKKWRQRWSHRCAYGALQHVHQMQEAPLNEVYIQVKDWTFWLQLGSLLEPSSLECRLMMRIMGVQESTPLVCFSLFFNWSHSSCERNIWFGRTLYWTISSASLYTWTAGWGDFLAVNVREYFLFPMSACHLITLQTVFLSSCLLFRAVRGKKNSKILLPCMWCQCDNRVVNYLTHSVAVKTNRRQASETSITGATPGEIKALESNDFISFTCCYIIYTLLTHPSTPHAYEQRRLQRCSAAVKLNGPTSRQEPRVEILLSLCPSASNAGVYLPGLSFHADLNPAFLN